MITILERYAKIVRLGERFQTGGSSLRRSQQMNVAVGGAQYYRWLRTCGSEQTKSKHNAHRAHHARQDNFKRRISNTSCRCRYTPMVYMIMRTTETYGCPNRMAVIAL
jgi:hypothetical protein